jgi:hypothetical protein
LSRLSVQTTSGLFVLLAGLAVVSALTVGAKTTQPLTEPTSASFADAPVVLVPPPTIDGVDLAVQRVLYASGKAQALRVDELSQLPPAVARVLATFGATLTIPVSHEGAR